ncbi:hypothetical protein BASA81_006542 [Batrachochytrium salamandrivorans]|nr:hypothetical protein BASA81_006542 [Batrachochytrium salamandrivorans]
MASQILFAWPSDLPHALPKDRQISEQTKSVALSFLSQLDVEEENSPSQASERADALQEQEALLIRMRQERRAPTSHALNLARFKSVSRANNNSQRIFLSWDRSYPLMVFSLVTDPKKQQQQHRAVKQEAHHPKANLLLAPRDETLSLQHLEHDSENNTDGESSDSSSEEEGSTHYHRHGRKAISYRFLLHIPSYHTSNNNNNNFTTTTTNANLEDFAHSPHSEPESPTSAKRKLGEDFQLGAVGSGGSNTPSNNNNNNNGTGEDSGHGGNHNDNCSTNPSRHSWDVEYSYYTLDDSKIIQGKHRVVQNMSAMRTSIIPYIKTKVLKQELNTQFGKQNPNLPEDLTLSKMRKLKRIMLQVALAADHELSSIALAYVYLEKLILKRVVHKANRKLVAFTCLVVAIKFNESGGVNKTSELIEEIVSQHKISLEEINKTEFAVFAHLHFNLHLPARNF